MLSISLSVFLAILAVSGLVVARCNSFHSLLATASGSQINEIVPVQRRALTLLMNFLKSRPLRDRFYNKFRFNFLLSHDKLSFVEISVALKIYDIIYTYIFLDQIFIKAKLSLNKLRH